RVEGTIRWRPGRESQSRTAATGVARQGDRALAQARVRFLDLPRLRTAGAVEVPARNCVRSVRLHGRAPDGAGATERILRCHLPSSRQGEAAGLVASGGAGEVRGTRSRLRP